jgi:hypothetical protein
MSSSLVYRIPQQAKDLPDELKYILEKAYQLPWKFTRQEIDYLRGLDDCGIKGAATLIELIEKHEEIEVKLEY